jgi:hypothetical protein
MTRGRWQGTRAVLRFNWHFFVVPLAILALALGACAWWRPEWLGWMLAPAVVTLLGLLVPVAATAWTYDLSGLYGLEWLDPWMEGAASAANIHAGFDESSALLQHRFPEINWRVFDFYDPDRHTEVSIRRARAAAPTEPGTVSITTRSLPVKDKGLDRVLLILAAHEIRVPGERAAFFHELRRALADNGLVVVVEHLRDWRNVLAYSLGAGHFHPRRTWLEAFRSGGFHVRRESRLHPLLTTFILEKDAAVD